MTKTTNATIKSATTVITAQKHYDAMLKIANKAATWHSTSYKKASDELFALLGECYATVADIRKQGTAIENGSAKVSHGSGVIISLRAA